MKKNFLLLVVILTCFLHSANAQISVHVNLGIQPVWGPTGHDYVEYYYIPDLDAYYDVTNQQYIFFEDGRWIPMSNLPPQYANFDLYGSYKVVINQPSPWMHNDRYRSQYAGYRGRHGQAVIRDSRDQKYWANPGHPQHGNWHGDNNGNRGQGGGQSRGAQQHGGQQRGGQDQHGGQQRGGQPQQGGGQQRGGQPQQGGGQPRGGQDQHGGGQPHGGQPQQGGQPRGGQPQQGGQPHGGQPQQGGGQPRGGQPQQGGQPHGGGDHGGKEEGHH